MKFENISASYDIGIAKQLGIPSAVLLNKLIYLSKYTSREDGYCWRTAKELEDELGLTRSQQDLAIKKLEEAGLIETKNTYIIGTQIKCKHFKVLCKSEVEESRKPDFQETCKSEMQENAKPVNNNNTIIIKHNKKEIIKEKYFEDAELNSLFNDFLELRVKLKAKNTDKAIKLLLNELNKWDLETQKQMINNSIMSSWKSVYPIKGKKQNILPKWYGKEIRKEELSEDAKRIYKEICRND